jgi:hypothetical protein
MTSQLRQHIRLGADIGGTFTDIALETPMIPQSPASRSAP